MPKRKTYAFKGGPLDGCTLEADSRVDFWVGPDPGDPGNSLVAYRLVIGNGPDYYCHSIPMSERVTREWQERTISS